MSLGKRSIRSSGFMFLSGYFVVIVSFLGNLVLARLLLPKDFGVYALAQSVLSLVFMIAGFGSQESIIQNRDEMLVHFVPTAFWISFGIAFILSLLGSVIGLLLVDDFAAPIPTFILILSWLQFLSSIGHAYSSVLQRELEFKIIAILQFSGTLASFTIAIASALLGAGVWALMIRESVMVVIVVVGYVLGSRYSLAFAFNRQSARTIWNFGWRLMVTRISEVIFGRFDNLMVGTILGPVILGYYSMAYRLTSLGHQLTQSAIQPVAFSAFSAIQNSPNQLQYGFDRLMYWLSRVTILMSIAVLVLGRDLVVLIYGEKWIVAGIIFQNMWLFFGIMPIHEAVRHVLISTGHITKVVSARIAILVIFIPSLVLATLSGDILLVAWTVNLCLLLSTALMLYQIVRVVEVQWLYLLRNPLLAGLIGTALVLLTRHEWLTGKPTYINVFIGILQLAIFFCGMLLILEFAAIRTEFRIIWLKLFVHSKSKDHYN